MAYKSYITAVQAVYASLADSSFPGNTKPPLFFDEAPTTSATGQRQSPPYVILSDEGGTNKWTFSSSGDTPAQGQNAIEIGAFRLEVYAFTLGEADGILDAILWNNQIPNKRAGIAFCTLSLVLPQVGMAGAVIPTRDQRSYSGLQYNNQRVHCATQWFKTQIEIRGTGV